MSIDAILSQATADAVKALYGLDFPASKIVPQTTKKEFEGNETIVVFPFLKASHKGPEQTGQEIGEYLLKNCPAVSAFNVIKGFLNLTIAPSFWVDTLNRVATTPHYGWTAATESSPLVMIEYSSPNTNKPLHLGHIRNNLLGYSLARILEACGNRVVKTNIVNDRGIHICKSMLAWLKWGNGITPEKAGKKGDHLIGDFYVLFDKHYKQEVADLMAKGMDKEQAEREAPLIVEAHEMLRKWEAGDTEVRELWKTMNSWVYAGFDETYRRLGVAFDKIYYESDTYLVGKQTVLDGLERGLFYRREDGSVWADLRGDGLDEKLLLRSDGTSVYMTQDIGTAQLRYRDYPIDKMIYVVGNEQNYHFQVLSILLDRLGFKWGKDLVHFSYGMVELPNGKMKSREGTVVDADDLMDEMIATARAKSEEPRAARTGQEGAETTPATTGRLNDLAPEERDEVLRKIGLGALKYFILKVDPRKNMLFNPEESIDFNGNTGAFIQYTYARIQSLLRKAGEDTAADISAVTPDDKETALIQLLADYGETVQEAGRNYSPALIANYAYELAKQYNQFYHDHPIMRESDGGVRAMRLLLSRTVATIIESAMSLLGIEVPERM